MPVSKQQIIQAANAVHAQGIRPTTLAVRAHLGAGACATISTVLREWRQQREPVGAGIDTHSVDQKLRDLMDGFQERLWQTIRLDLDEKIEQLHERSEQLFSLAEQEQDELNHALDNIIEDNQRQDSKIRELDKQLVVINKALQNAQQDAQVAQNKADAISGERDRLLAETQQLNKKLTALNVRYEKNTDELAKLKTQLELEKGVAQQTKQQTVFLEHQLKVLSQQCEEQIQGRLRAETRATKLEKERQDLVTKSTRLSHEHEQWKSKAMAIEHELADLSQVHEQTKQLGQTAQTKAEVVIGERDRLLNDNKTWTQKVERLTAENKKYADELVNLKAQLELERSKHQHVKQRCDALNDQLKDAKRHAEDLTQQRRSAENRANRVEEEATAHRKKYQSLVDSFEAERIKLQQKLDDERQAKQDLNKMVGEMRVKLAQLEGESQKTLVAYQQEINRFQRTVDQLEMTLDAERAKHKAA